MTFNFAQPDTALVQLVNIGKIPAARNGEKENYETREKARK
jgi:hypothetical protein